ncbi:hypothetical protein ACVME8_000296 [Bradyrhizobium diazoefficiens]
MDRHNYDPTNVTASSQVQHDLLQEQQAGQAGQEAFEQQLHEARQADTAMPDRGTPPNVSSDGQQSPDEPIGALAGSHLLPSEKVLIKDGHDTAELRPTNRPRTPDYPQAVAIERQLSEVANSVGGGGAMPGASAPQPAQLTLVSIAGTKRKQPLYSKDALVVLGFREALIEGKLAESFVQRIVGPLLSFGRWLCVNNKMGIVARLDNNSLTDGGDVFQHNGNSDLILALDHLRTWRSTGRVPRPAPVRKRQKASTVYPHVSGCDRELIREVAQGVIASRKLKDAVANGYTRNLNRLANDLGERGLSLDGSSDAFLLAHAKEIFKGDKLMRAAVGALREHRAPNAPGASSIGGRPPLPPADGDEGLIKGAISHALESNKLSSTTAQSYDWALRKFSRELGLDGDSLSALDHVALRVNADRLFRNVGWKMVLDGGLKALREYRQAKASGPSVEGASGADGSQQGAGEATQSPMVDVDPEELRQLLDDEADEPPIMADDPELLPPEQELPEETQGPRDHQSGPLSALEPSVRDDHAPEPAESFPDLSGHRDLQQAAHELMGALEWSNFLPSEEVLINDEHGTAELRPAKRPRTLDNPQEVAIQGMLIGNGNSGGRVLMQAPIHQVGARPWDAAAQHSAPQEAVSSPVVIPAENYDQDLLWGGADEAASPPSRETSASHPQAPDSREAVHPLNWPHNHQGALDEMTGRNLLPSRQEGRIEAMVHPNPFELRDDLVPTPDFRPLFAGTVPGHHQGDRQPGSPQGLSPVPASSDDEALACEELSRRQMQEPASPSTGRAPSDIYGGLESLVDLTTFTPSDLRDDAHFAPAPSARARSDNYGALDPFIDLTAPTLSPLRDDAVSVPVFPSTSADAQIVALNPTASSRGLVLDDEQWLGDEHILRDYQLLEQDLLRHPLDIPTLDIAARTRLVDPTVAHNLLRSPNDTVVELALQRIVYDDNGNDTADFLFLPVNDADPTDPRCQGNHWSLLFVDRRDRNSPIAYHYDSFWGFNETSADHLAGRLGLPGDSVQAGMAQQQNGWDCGVFVVDGTRALVRGLVAGQRGLQNLSNLSVSRPALQTRLRG